MRFLRRSYGSLPVDQFGPLKLSALQNEMIAAGQSRRYINDNIDRIRLAFKWGTANELVPVTINQALATVPGLRKGRSKARETVPVMPVANDTVDATLPHLQEVVADIVRFQRLTGCRPDEACSVRPCDVDTSDDVWLYRPHSHKCEHLGRERVIFVGPQCQDILRKYLLRPDDAYCFSPEDSEKKRRAQQHEARRTPLSYGNRPGTNRKRNLRWSWWYLLLVILQVERNFPNLNIAQFANRQDAPGQQGFVAGL